MISLPQKWENMRMPCLVGKRHWVSLLEERIIWPIRLEQTVSMLGLIRWYRSSVNGWKRADMKKSFWQPKMKIISRRWRLLFRVKSSQFHKREWAFPIWRRKALRLSTSLNRKVTMGRPTRTLWKIQRSIISMRSTFWHGVMPSFAPDSVMDGIPSAP